MHFDVRPGVPVTNTSDVIIYEPDGVTLISLVPDVVAMTVQETLHGPGGGTLRLAYDNRATVEVEDGDSPLSVKLRFPHEERST